MTNASEANPVTVLERLDVSTELEDVILATPSAVRFRKLGEKFNLLVHVQGTRCHIEEVLYLSKGDGRAVGDVKEPARTVRVFSITLTNGFDFGVQAIWYERFPMTRDGVPKPPVFEFDSAFVGGPRSGHNPPKLLTQSTKTIEEVTQCLSQE